MSKPSLLPLFLLRGIALAFLFLSAGRAAEVAKRHFDIPADVAEKSLKLFATQSATDVLFSTEMVANARTSAVSGDLSPTEAIALLLANTGLSASQDRATGAFTIQRPKSASRSEDTNTAKKKP